LLVTAFLHLNSQKTLCRYKLIICSSTAIDYLHFFTHRLCTRQHAGLTEQILKGTAAQLRLYSAIHVGPQWKIKDRRQIKNTDNTETKHNPEKANNVKQHKTKLSWFSRLL